MTAVKTALRAHRIELPSWAFGNTGTRFKVFAQPGVPRTPQEKIEDAAQVHAFTGVAPSVALHIPWDRVDDYAALAALRRASAGSAIGDGQREHVPGRRLQARQRRQPGSARSARKAVDHLLECVDIMDATGSRGPEALVRRRHQLPRPGRHHAPARTGWPRRWPRSTSGWGRTSGCCWSTSCSSRRSTPPTCPTGAPRCVHCLALGPQAAVVVDTGHHAPGTNIEFIVAMLLRAGRLGGFDFNSRFYADDDLMVGRGRPVPAVPDPARGGRGGALRPEAGVAFMLDQCHNIEPKIPAQIRSVMNVQEATAKALLVDRAALAAAQQAGDVLGANAVLMDAYNTDVRPLLAGLREEHGPGPRPDRRLPALRLPGEDRRRARRRHPGRLGQLSRHGHPTAASERLTPQTSARTHRSPPRSPR